jgi:hypothetical protein
MLDFTSDTHRLNAKRDRERGGSTVRVHKSTAAMHRREDAEMSEWRTLASVARVAYRDACSEARAAFTEACSGGYAELSAPGFGDL